MAHCVSETKPFSLVDSHCCKRVTFAAIKHVVSYRILPAPRGAHMPSTAPHSALPRLCGVIDRVSLRDTSTYVIRIF